MIVYKYNENGNFIKSIKCQIDPLASAAAGKDVYLIPPMTTEKEPLPEKSGWQVIFDGKDWVYIEDYKPSEEEQKAAEIAELKDKLAASDYAVIKIAEGAATVEDYAELIAQRQAWRARINELEGE